MTGTCGTCKHWDLIDPDWELEALGYGVCRRILLREEVIDAAREPYDDRWGDQADEAADRAVRSSMAILSDGSGYRASIHCSPDFGCTLHSPRTP